MNHGFSREEVRTPPDLVSFLDKLHPDPIQKERVLDVGAVVVTKQNATSSQVPQALF